MQSCKLYNIKYAITKTQITKTENAANAATNAANENEKTFENAATNLKCVGNKDTN